MVRWSIRVVLVAENEVSNPHCLSSDFQLRGRRRSMRSSLYFITRKNYFLFYTMSGGSHQLENVTHMSHISKLVRATGVSGFKRGEMAWDTWGARKCEKMSSSVII